MSEDVAGSHQGGAVHEDEDIAACQSCRKRKLRCSRQLPTCENCNRLSLACVYEHKKQKPGLKAGAVANLTQRLEVLEKILLEEDGSQKRQVGPDAGQNFLYQASLLLAKELQKFEPGSLPANGASDHIGSFNGDGTGQNHRASISSHHAPVTTPQLPTRKRRRENEEGPFSPDNNDFGSDQLPLPFPHLFDKVIDAYFNILQHWIPFLHQTRFKARLEDPEERSKCNVLLHAMFSATIRFVADPSLTAAERDRQARRSRNFVMLSAMETLSLESVQSLIIVAFDHIMSGNVSKSWSIIGSLTRTVGYLQLSTEPFDERLQSLLRPLTLLESTRTLTEAEERRRVFWNIFLLDRFCSFTTGWDTSLTSDDVHRQLPCDGGLWHKGEAVSPTPYFGIWNKSSAKLGRSLAFIPAHYPSPDHANLPKDWSPGTNAETNTSTIDTSKLGAFSYNIEATESLSQVTMFFLQQRIDFDNRQEVGSWLTRFKELDLRLVHWKMFLPSKWQDSDVSRNGARIEMDPNLTLAHITHNTSMILLHHNIAYPPREWTGIVSLPSACSAETCRMAAVETAGICRKFLRYREGGIANGQFSFCTFVAAKVLLVQWCCQDGIINPEFFNLVESLKGLSNRWSNPHGTDTSSAEDPEHLDIAGKHAAELLHLYTTCNSNAVFKAKMRGGSLLPTILIAGAKPTMTFTPPAFNMSSPAVRQQYGEFNYRVPLQTSGQDPNAPQTALQPYTGVPPDPSAYGNVPNGGGYQFVGMPGGNRNNSVTGDHSSTGGGVEDGLSTMSHMMLGQNFLELDRVITLEDTTFAIDADYW